MTAGNPYAVKSLTSMEDLSTEDLKELAGPEELAEELRRLNGEELGLVRHTLRAIRKSRIKDLHFYGHFLGVELPEKDAAVPESKMYLGPHNANYFGVAQGGALYSFADVTIGYLILSKLEPGKRLVTLELKMNYVKPGTGSVLRCVPDILHWGRRTVVAECRIRNEQDQLVATALGTFMVSN